MWSINRTSAVSFLRDNFYIVIPLCIVTVFTIFVWSKGLLPDFFFGENFLLYHYAETHNFDDAVRLFFLQNGRYFEGLYWITFYKVFGFQPSLAYLYSLMLNFIVAVLGASAVFQVLPSRSKTRVVYGLFLLTFFFFPTVMKWNLSLSGDNSRLANILFWGSILLLQRWAMAPRQVFLVIGAGLFFVAGVFTYESIALLFPASLLLVTPILSKRIRENRKVLFGLSFLGLASLFLVILPIQLYEFMGTLYGPGFTHPSMRAASQGWATHELIGTVLSRVARYTVDLNKVFISNIEIEMRLVQMVMVAIAIYIAARLALAWYRKKRFRKRYRINDELVALTSLYGAALWIYVMGLVPFAVGNSNSIVHERVYSAAVVAVPMLLVLCFIMVRKKLIKTLLLGIVFLVMVLGIKEFLATSEDLRAYEFEPELDYAGIVEAVPAVQPDTAFFFVDNEFGRSPWYGCSLALRMLYSTPGLRCAYLSSETPGNEAVWNGAALSANQGGYFNDENWIVIGTDPNGQLFVIPELDQSENLNITWLSSKAIQTDYRRILADKFQLTDMLQHLLERKAQR